MDMAHKIFVYENSYFLCMQKRWGMNYIAPIFLYISYCECMAFIMNTIRPSIKEEKKA